MSLETVAAPPPSQKVEAKAGEPDLARLMDLTLPVVIELGRTRMTIQEVLALGRGSLVELQRLAGEPVDVFVSDRHFAEGEVVVVGDQFAVRITRILPVTRRDEGEALS